MVAATQLLHPWNSNSGQTAFLVTYATMTSMSFPPNTPYASPAFLPKVCVD